MKGNRKPSHLITSAGSYLARVPTRLIYTFSMYFFRPLESWTWPPPQGRSTLITPSQRVESALLYPPGDRQAIAHSTAIFQSEDKLHTAEPKEHLSFGYLNRAASLPGARHRVINPRLRMESPLRLCHRLPPQQSWHGSWRTRRRVPVTATGQPRATREPDTVNPAPGPGRRCSSPWRGSRRWWSGRGPPPPSEGCPRRSPGSCWAARRRRWDSGACWSAAGCPRSSRPWRSGRLLPWASDRAPSAAASAARAARPAPSWLPGNTRPPPARFHKVRWVM